MSFVASRQLVEPSTHVIEGRARADGQAEVASSIAGAAVGYAHIVPGFFPIPDHIDPTLSLNVAPSNMTVTNSVYCFHGLDFPVHDVMATLGSEGVGENDIIRATVGDGTGMCGAGTQASVFIQDAGVSTSFQTGREFMVLFN